MSSENTSPLLSVRPRSVLASRPLLLRGEDFGFNAWSATEYDRDTDRSCWSPLSGFMLRFRHHPMREDVKRKHFSTLSVRPRSVLASRPLLLRGEDFGFNARSGSAYRRDPYRICWSAFSAF